MPSRESRNVERGGNGYHGRYRKSSSCQGGFLVGERQAYGKPASEAWRDASPSGDPALVRVGVRTAVAAVLASLAVLAGPVAPSPAATRSCSEDDRFLQNVRATNVPCKAAVGVAKAWARNGACFRGEGDTLAAAASRRAACAGIAAGPPQAARRSGSESPAGARTARFGSSTPPELHPSRVASELSLLLVSEPVGQPTSRGGNPRGA